MFCGALANSKDVISVPDIEPSTLENVLQCMYSGKVDKNADTVLSLLYAAKKYDIPGLETQCKLFLNDNIDAENVCTILDQAILFDDRNMKHTSLDFIIKVSESVLKSDAFVRISKSGLHEVLNLEPFNASECELYAACKRWATQRCRDAGKEENFEHIRHELGDELIYLVRFPTMTFEEFTNVVASENVLIDSELLSVYRSIANKENVSQFINKPRQALTAVTICVFTKDDHLHSDLGCIVAQDGFSFTVSKHCELSALYLCLPPDARSSVTGVLELLEGTTVIHAQYVKLRRNEGSEHLLFNLDKRLHLKSMYTYYIRQRLTRKLVHTKPI